MRALGEQEREKCLKVVGDLEENLIVEVTKRARQWIRNRKTDTYRSRKPQDLARFLGALLANGNRACLIKARETAP